MLITLFVLFILLFLFGLISWFCASADEGIPAIIFGIISLFIFSAGITATVVYWCMT